MSFWLSIFVGIVVSVLFHLSPLFGIVLGIFIYIKTNKSPPRFHWHTNHGYANIPTTFHHHCFALMGYLAKADGVISAQEIKVAESCMQELCLNYTQKALAKQSFKKGSHGINLSHTISFLQILNHTRPDLVERFFDYQDKIIHADTFKSMNQINILNQIKFHVSQQQQHQQTHTAPPITKTTLSQAYKKLGISPSMDFATMKRTYRKLVGKHHPDRQQTPQAKQKAEAYIKDIQSAWSIIKKHHAKESA